MMSPPPPLQIPRDFWREVAHPHATELAELKASLATLVRLLDDPYSAPDYSRTEKAANGNRIARYARSLDPSDHETAYYAGVFADATGRSIEAERLFQIFVDDAPFGLQQTDSYIHLGVIALRQGRYKTAIALLRRSSNRMVVDQQQFDRFMVVRSQVALAHALEASGDLAAAIDVLQVLTEQIPLDADPASVAAHLALAVMYDRDEQITLAFEQLLRMRTALDAEFNRLTAEAIRTLPPPIATDAYYYRALASEVAPIPESSARDQWLAFERSSAAADAVARAHDHRIALDQERLADVRRRAQTSRRHHP